MANIQYALLILDMMNTFDFKEGEKLLPHADKCSKRIFELKQKFHKNNIPVCAKVKLLAELVEHHIKEEENTFLPDYKKHSDIQERRLLGEVFMSLKTSMGMEYSVFTDAMNLQEDQRLLIR